MTSNLPAVQKPKPFWQSKGFWGSVIATVGPFIPVVGPFVGAFGGILAGLGRTVAEGPLTIRETK